METVKPILTCSVRFQREKYKNCSEKQHCERKPPDAKLIQRQPCATESRDSTQSDQLYTIRP